MKSKAKVSSWGNYPPSSHDVISQENLPLIHDQTKKVLPYGNGRSYGDVCLNDNGTLIDTRCLDHFISFDEHSGVISCEGGVLFSQILELIVPKGWFLPVTPGTQYITLGGAIANDVHGKNHHNAGAFGRHIRRLELLRSDGSRLECSATKNAQWFKASIGGLGLTGLITWAEIQLLKVGSPLIEQQSKSMLDLTHFFEFSRESASTDDYSVAWIDCLAKGSEIGKGVFFTGKHIHSSQAQVHVPKRSPLALSVPVDLPGSVFNRFSVGVFNRLYYGAHLRQRDPENVHYRPFFYPLDKLQHWNRLYGKRGFLQYQCLIPSADQEPAIREILRLISQSTSGSFLAVLKQFGDIPSPGLLSFPRAGTTLALDFPIKGKETFELLESLDSIVLSAGGAIYPAKDARMSATMFKVSFPQWEELVPYIDPKFSSSFWRRVTE